MRPLAQGYHNGSTSKIAFPLASHPDRADKRPVQAAPVGRITNRLAAIYLNIPPRTAVAGGQALLKQTIDSVRAGNPNFEPSPAHCPPKFIVSGNLNILMFGPARLIQFNGPLA